jgi:hypothetical protein
VECLPQRVSIVIALSSLDSNHSSGPTWFYLRDGKFIAAPPEYQTLDIVHYLAPSGRQWTMSKSGVKQVSSGRVTEYPLSLNRTQYMWTFADSHGNLWFGERSGLGALIAQVQVLIAGGTLTQNHGSGLIDKLNQVSTKLDANQTAAACNQLQRFHQSSAGIHEQPRS